MNRRQFLTHVVRTVPAVASGVSLLARQRALAATPPNPEPSYTLPSHLPKKLAISMFLWNWISLAGGNGWGKAYTDLERVVAGLVERGFNAVRAEAGLNWCFRMDGQPRGEVAFGRSGFRLDVLKRVVRLMELAKKHGVYVIWTDWEYQDSTNSLADSALRKEVMSIPEADRLMCLARQHDRFLRFLKQRDLHKNIAFVEIANEVDCSEFPKGPAGKKAHTEAIAFLRDRHSDILISGDYTVIRDPALIPDNTQVYDIHCYTGSPYQDLYAAAGFKAGELEGTKAAEDLERNTLLRRLLKKSFKPYSQYVDPNPNAREFWRKVNWLYGNVDIRALDEWFIEQYHKNGNQWKATVSGRFAKDAEEAQRRHIPAVSDEGGYFAPAPGSQFELTEPGLSMFDLRVDLAIKHSYWGVMPTTYCGPEFPLWENVKWLQTINGRFLAGKLART